MAEMHKLKNGMEVLLEENHSAPVISFHILIKVGSAMESPYEAGISHLIEHMLFKGTPTRKVGDIAKDVESAGGEINAYTSLDQTVYYINMASRFARKGLAILSDAVQHPLFDAEELEREKEVVLEEIRRENDNPSHRNAELMFSRSYRRHTYKNPIIGTERSVKSFTRADILRYYKRWYTPKNMTLVVVGQFDSKAVLKEIEKEFSRFTGGNAPKIKLPTEPTQKEMIIATEANPILASYFSLSFHIPEITHEDVPALDILSHVLSGSDNSRLPQEVREKKQLVNAVYSYAFTPKDPGLFAVGGLSPAKKTVPAIKAIWDEIHKTQQTTITNSELDRAKLIIRSNEIYEKETSSGQAGKYIYFIATTGSHAFEGRYYQMLQDVSADDVRRVAQKYLTPENMTIVTIHPKEAKVNTRELKAYIKSRRASAKAVKTARSHVAPPLLHRLPNGLRLIIRENHTLPVVACCAAVNGGLRFEDKRNNGINQLVSQVMVKGTMNRTAVEIADKLESIAGGIYSFSGRNSFGLKGEFLSSKFGEGFALFSEILREPSFVKPEIEIERSQLLDAIKNQEDSLTSLAFDNFLNALFPDHPYGLRPLGERSSVERLSQKTLKDFYARMMHPKGIVLSVSGDISAEEVIKSAEASLKLPTIKGRSFHAPLPQKAPKSPITVEKRRAEKEQAHVVVGFLGPTMSSKDRYAIGVLNNILSGQGGRLFVKLRDEMSLAYSVSSTYFTGIEPGFFAIYIGTDPSKLSTAIGGIKNELMQLLKGGVSATELIRAKNHLIGGYELDRQKNLSVAGSYAFNLLYDLGLAEFDKYPDNINKIKLSDITKVAAKYIKLDAPVISIVKPD